MTKLKLLADMTRHSSYALRAIRCGWNELVADSATTCAVRDAKRFLDACEDEERAKDFVLEARRSGIGAVKAVRRGDEASAALMAKVAVVLLNEAMR